MSFAGKLYAHQIVRTDCREQKLDAFFTPSSKTKDKLPSTASTAVSDSALDDLIMCIDENDELSPTEVVHKESRTVDNPREPIEEKSRGESSSTRFSPVSAETDGNVIPPMPSRREIKLTSVRQLQNDIESNIHDS